jgi:hypothetical protein
MSCRFQRRRELPDIQELVGLRPALEKALRSSQPAWVSLRLCVFALKIEGRGARSFAGGEDPIQNMFFTCSH